jgi:hypothetical protein
MEDIIIRTPITNDAIIITLIWSEIGIEEGYEVSIPTMSKDDNKGDK